jgi:hypothetical protein
MNSFCGNICEDCIRRNELHCAGCAAGPARFSGGCAIADCCREKGHSACGTCTRESACGLYKSARQMPETRLAQREMQQARHQWLQEQSPVLGRWLGMLFWIAIVSQIAGVMTNENLVKRIPVLRLPGLLFVFACGMVYALILWRLRGIEARYGKAALGLAASEVFSVSTVLIAQDRSSGLVLALTALALAGSVYGCYQEFHAHGEVLAGLDDTLAENWRKLWKWEIGLALGAFGCIFLVLFSAVLGVLATLAVAIGLVIAGILRLVYLWRTAKRFRNFSMESQEA